MPTNPGWSRDDRVMLSFAISWIPYGGVPVEEIYPRFGLDQNQFVQRLRDAVERNLSTLNPETAQLLLAMCGQRRAVSMASLVDPRISRP